MLINILQKFWCFNDVMNIFSVESLSSSLPSNFDGCYLVLVRILLWKNLNISTSLPDIKVTSNNMLIFQAISSHATLNWGCTVYCFIINFIYILSLHWLTLGQFFVICLWRKWARGEFSCQTFFAQLSID